MNCPKCKSEKAIKNGFTRGQQRYKCKVCGYNYSVERKSDVKPPEMRKLALEMYLEGLGFRAIGRILKISYGTVYQWIKQFGEQAKFPVSASPVPIVELDEMHTYIRTKKLPLDMVCC